MKKTILLLATSVFGYLALTGYSTGVAGAINPQNRTGAGGSVGSCYGSSCHNQNNSNLGLSIALYDLVGGFQVSNGKYVPNTPYQIRITGQISSGGSYPTFAYQLTTESQGSNYGAFFNNNNRQSVVLAPYEIIEPFAPLPASNITETQFRDTLDWIAPPAGNKNVTIYLTMLASNDDGSINGDVTNNTNSIFQEQATAVADLGGKVKTQLYPNPANDFFNVSISGAEPGMYTIAAYNTTGAIAEKRTVSISNSDTQLNFNTSAWASGNYFVMIRKGDAQRVLRFVKQ